MVGAYLIRKQMHCNSLQSPRAVTGDLGVCILPAAAGKAESGRPVAAPHQPVELAKRAIP